MRKELRIVGMLAVIAAIMGAFTLLSAAVPAEAEEMPQPVATEPECQEIPHEEAAEYLEKGDHVYTLTDEERDLVERVVAAEARGESLEGMMGVAQTIRDRCITRNQSPKEVCLAPYQYAAPYDGEISDMVKDAVLFTFDIGDSALEYPTTHFYGQELIAPPDWTYSKTCRGTIGGATFYY
ncbi:MAG: hypothetical protein ACI4LN_06935 [Anaerovoracaceae bacterium]